VSASGVRIWPNLLSLVRLPLAGWFVLADGAAVRTAIVIIAAATDWFDGRIARRFGGMSRLGELLDPVADKVFLGVVFVVFTWEGALQAWEFAALLARDVVVVLGAFGITMAGFRVRLPARISGKVTTTVQLLTVVVLLVAPRYSKYVVAAIVPAALWAIVDYALAGVRTLEAGTHALDDGTE